MVMRSGPVARLVLLILIGFSIISWAIIFQKFRFFRKASKESDRFNELFNENRNMAVVYASSKKLRHSPLARMFLSAYGEISRGHQPSFNDRDELSLGYLEKKEELAVDYVQKITRLLNRVSNQEVGRLEKMLGFLATTGSATPFIGLFGTVWGVMNAFQGIGARGSANIATVAPGISEALIATAAGLAAAIPAVIAYNYFVNQIKVLATAMDDFSSRFIDYTEREAAKRFL
ncbi:MAG: protein TolQ [Candidatus Tectomicrobia bacterium]|uniref:Protein TolQ n=1 Tax=Tectimicrobiota bacterium TaxID=2528274 RepID=A0A933LQG9_UNCTE|nr:protein TolQ [Candidatus Tectomicrobia bacterium]